MPGGEGRIEGFVAEYGACGSGDGLNLCAIHRRESIGCRGFCFPVARITVQRIK